MNDHETRLFYTHPEMGGGRDAAIAALMQRTGCSLNMARETADHMPYQGLFDSWDLIAQKTLNAFHGYYRDPRIDYSEDDQ